MPETMNMEELKNAVAATLEKKGILSKMRAQLRKEVFEVIDESEENTDQNHILHAITRSTTECMLADLVREYLDFYELDHTLTVFQAEAGFTEKIRPRGVLAGFMGLGIKPDRNFPLMSEVLKESESFNRGIIRCSEENNKSELVLREREKPEKIQLTLGEFGESEDNEFDNDLLEGQHRPKTARGRQDSSSPVGDSAHQPLTISSGEDTCDDLGGVISSEISQISDAPRKDVIEILSRQSDTLVSKRDSCGELAPLTGGLTKRQSPDSSPRASLKKLQPLKKSSLPSLTFGAGNSMKLPELKMSDVKSFEEATDTLKMRGDEKVDHDEVDITGGSNPEHELAEIDRKLKLIDAEQLKLDQDVNKNQEEDQSDIDDIDEVSGESFSSMGEESSDASPSDISDNYNPYKIPSDQDGRDAARDFDVALKSASSAIEQSPTKSNRSLESLEDLESSDLDYSIDETVSEGEIQELGDHLRMFAACNYKDVKTHCISYCRISLKETRKLM
eukprot:531614_1